MKYKVGDKVKVRSWEEMEKQYGLDFDGDINISVCFVKSMREYCGKILTINRVCSDHYNMAESCWNWTDEMLKPAHETKIVITSDGKETLARLYEGDKVVKKATAKCSPDDTFDFNVGAKLAFERLMNEEKKKEEPPKYFNGKAVCIETKPHFAYTVGKVYEFKGGTTVIDNGIRVYTGEPIKSIEEWNEFHGSFAKMLAIVE